MDNWNLKQLAVSALVVGALGFGLGSAGSIVGIANANVNSGLDARIDTLDEELSAVATELYVRTSAAEYGGDIAPSSLAEALAMPCATEDSIDCYWIASARTNGIGASFVNVEGHIFPLSSVLGDAS